MSLLSRVLIVIGLSFVMTLLLMVIHFEPERRVAPLTAGSPPPLLVLVTATAVEKSPEHIQTAQDISLRDTDGADWTMAKVEDIAALSSDIRAALTGCLVPRSPDVPNIISAELKRAGQTDLAVLCVRDQRAAVYVFWGGEPGAPDIATEVEFIPGISIRAATADTIRVEVTRELPLDPGMPNRIRHDGIQLGHGCCATTQYWHRGRWRSYVSAD